MTTLIARNVGEMQQAGLNSRKGGSLLPISILVAFATLLVAIAVKVGGERRAIRALPDAQRALVYTRTMDDLRAFCGENRLGALRDHCVNLSEFVAQFQECNSECEALVRSQRERHPTR
jgi:hypothetical protein